MEAALVKKEEACPAAMETIPSRQVPRKPGLERADLVRGVSQSSCPPY